MPSGPARAASRSARWLGVRGGRPLFLEDVTGTAGGGDSSCCSSGAGGGGGDDMGGGTLEVAEGKVELEEMQRGAGGVEMEEMEGLEELVAVMVALLLPFPWPVSPLPQPQFFLPSLLPPHFLLSSPLSPPPASAPASSSKDSLPVQIQFFFGGHPASFLQVDPDLIQVPRTTVPSSLFWPWKQT